MEARQSTSAIENGENQIIALLDRHLASAIDLQLRIRNALWNAENPRLAEARELSATASEFQQFCDLIASRLRSLGAAAQATLQRTPTRSFLEPRPFVATGDEEQISVIDRALARFRSFAKPAREKAAVLHDQTTAALFGKLASTIDAQIWFLRSPSRLNDKLQPGRFREMSTKDAGLAKSKSKSDPAPSWCVHFRSMAQHETCKEGIGYTALNGGSEYRRMHRLPSFIRNDDKPGPRVHCERFKAPTVEEIALHEQVPDVQ